MIRIANKTVKNFGRTYIIAEAGVNHNGDINRALRLVRNAKASGADGVKFQVFRAEGMVSSVAGLADYQKKMLRKKKSAQLRTHRATHDKLPQTQYELLKSLELGENAFLRIADEARKNEIDLICTPFDRESVRFVKKMNVRAVKIASPDLVDFPLIREAASLGKPVILSTGQATLKEIKDTVEYVESLDNRKIILLHCISHYPADLEQMNLRFISTLQKEFPYPVGLSDHTDGLVAATIAVSLGACVVEKHFTLDRNLPGPDHTFSLEPQQFTEMVERIRNVEKALGSTAEGTRAYEDEGRKLTRKSIVAAQDIAKGARITENDLAYKRPGTGIMPKDISTVVGKIAAVSINSGEIIVPAMLKH